ncbi:glycosyltransferase family 4 protein [Ekhidna sp.]
MKKLKLRQITDHHLNSGIGRYSFELSKALIDLGHETRLSKLYKKDGDDTYFDNNYDWIDKIHYKSLRNLHSYILPYFISAHLFPKKADIYHAHWFMAGLGLGKAGKKNRVVTMHDVSLLHEIEKEGKFLNYYRNAINHFSKEGLPIIVVSESAKQDALKYSNLKEEQFFVVHNGVNFEQFFVKKEKEGGAGPFQLIYAGGLSPRKNVEMLLKSCAILESRGIDYQLKIAGNHPDRTPYPKLAQELKLKNVVFSGFIADESMNDFYNEADLFVYTSKYEGFGFAPLEAMAAGTPVITTKGGSLEEVSGGGAHLVEYDEESLAESIIALMQNSEQRKKLAANGTDWVKQYTWKNCAENTLKVYQTIAS